MAAYQVSIPGFPAGTARGEDLRLSIASAAARLYPLWAARNRPVIVAAAGASGRAKKRLKQRRGGGGKQGRGSAIAIASDGDDGSDGDSHSDGNDGSKSIGGSAERNGLAGSVRERLRRGCRERRSPLDEGSDKGTSDASDENTTVTDSAGSAAGSGSGSSDERAAGGRRGRSRPRNPPKKYLKVSMKPGTASRWSPAPAVPEVGDFSAAVWRLLRGAPAAGVPAARDQSPGMAAKLYIQLKMSEARLASSSDTGRERRPPVCFVCELPLASACECSSGFLTSERCGAVRCGVQPKQQTRHVVLYLSCYLSVFCKTCVLGGG